LEGSPAIAAKYAHPDRPVIGMVGDGAMQMNNMAELISVAKYWRDWADHRFIICVFNNEDLNQVTWEQRVMEGDPKFEASQSIPTCLTTGLPSSSVSRVCLSIAPKIWGPPGTRRLRRIALFSLRSNRPGSAVDAAASDVCAGEETHNHADEG
jgi:hypothetical protein